MAEAKLEKRMTVPMAPLLKTITDYESYKEFVEGVSNVRVLERNGEKVKVEYSLSIMGKDFTYLLEHTERPEKGEVEWHLIESDVFKKNSGSWKLREVDGHTEAVYDLEVEFKIYVPGFLLNKLVKGSLPTLLTSFEKRAKENA